MFAQEVKQIISDSKNIYLIPGEEPEATACTLALFYTLRNLGKNVNLIIEQLPENLKFLTPSLDFVSYPKNFVISIPNKVADVSQVHYEKSDEALKIHLTLGNGNIKKDNISFYFSEPKPDLTITIGVQDYSEQLKDKLDRFGFLLDSPVVDIDNKQDNKKFGKVNLIGGGSLAEIIFSLSENASKESAKCLLASLVIYTNNFRDKITADIFEIAGNLMKKGADLKQITDNLKS